MVLLPLLLLLSFLQAGTLAAPRPPPLMNKNTTVNWFPCTQNASLPVTCGTLAVPLDYTNKSSSQTIDIQLTKFNATRQPVKGSVLFNPGGPGSSTREFLAGYAREMMIATSGHYDLVAFETRGVGDTLPFSCFDSDAERSAFMAGVPREANSSDTSLGLSWAYGTALSEACYDRNRDIAPFLSTAFIARDMMRIVDALEEDKLLRYYGFSYGTVLGATAAAMFPHRIERMILDGVVNVAEWLYGSNGQLSLQSDAAVLAFLESCLQTPTCPIHRPANSTASVLYNEILAFLEEIKYRPLVLGSSVIPYDAVKPAIFAAVKTSMELARPLASYLNAVLSRNATAWTLTNKNNKTPDTDPAGPLYPNYGPEALYGIQCPDTQLRLTSLEEFRSVIAGPEYKQSHFGGPPILALAAPCLQWKTRSKETFTGPFTARTRTPILFVSSPLDPATPMASAWNMTRGFEGSVVLQQNGIGHTSIAQPSRCTIRATSAYFVDGTLPRIGTVCEPDYGYFANKTLLEQYLAVDR